MHSRACIVGHAYIGVLAVCFPKALEGANLIIQRDRLLTRIELGDIDPMFLLILHQL